MKLLIVLHTLIACGLAGSIPKVPISTFRRSIQASGAQPPILGRIVNGLPAYENQFPHQCAVLSPLENSHAFAICGGSIISASWVLTAAHCTIGYLQHNLRFGTITSTIGGQVQTAFDAISHPQYNSVNMNYDISIIPIPTPLTFTAAIQSIRLPTNSQIGSNFLDTTAIVSGWGSTVQGGGASQILNWASMRMISNNACRNVFGDDVVSDHVICGTGAGGPNQGHCSGDSGGPLTIVEAGQRTQIGIVSFGAASGCDQQYPSGYMRTANFIHWIYNNTGIPVRL